MRKSVSFCYYLLSFCFSALFVLSSCEQPQAQTISFQNNFPAVKAGSESIKISLRVNRPATVYYWLRNQIVNDISPEMIRTEALRLDNEGENQSGVIHFEQGTISHLINDLTAEKTYYLYMVPVEDSIDAQVSIYNATIQLRPRQVAASFANNDVVTGYLTYYPESFYLEDETDFPLIISLHGDGSQGTNLDRVRSVGLTRYVENGNNLSAIVISPQSRYTDWNDQGGSYAELASFYDEVVSALPIDENRVYLTGFSKGGKGTWEFAMNHPNKVAAIVPIAGFGNSSLACNLTNKPIWAFHNSGDNVVGVGGSRSLIDAVEDCGGNPLLTVYNASGHDAWTNTYNGSLGNNAISWMMQHRINSPGSVTNIEKEEIELAAFSIYPNPVNDQLQIKKINTSDSNFLLSVYDSTGRNLMEAKTRIDQLRRLDLRKLPVGKYWLVISGAQTHFRQTFVKY